MRCVSWRRKRGKAALSTASRTPERTSYQWGQNGRKHRAVGPLFPGNHFPGNDHPGNDAVARESLHGPRPEFPTAQATAIMQWAGWIAAAIPGAHFYADEALAKN